MVAAVPDIVSDCWSVHYRSRRVKQPSARSVFNGTRIEPVTDPFANTLVAWLVFAVVVYFVIARPVVAWWRVRVPHDPGLVPIRAGDPLLEGVLDRGREDEAALSQIGFQREATIWRTAGQNGRFLFFAWFENPSAKDDAVAFGGIDSAADRKASTVYLEFRTRYANRLSVRTRNATFSLAASPFPCAKETVLPAVRDPVALYRAHLANLDCLGSLGPKDRLGTGTANGSRLQAEWSEELALARAAGLLRRDKDEPFDRLTWRGAFVLGWRGTWPQGIGSVLRNLGQPPRPIQ